MKLSLIGIVLTNYCTHMYDFDLYQEHLKEILRSICVYNTKNPHKNMWELKPEYRHYDKKETNSE